MTAPTVYGTVVGSGSEGGPQQRASTEGRSGSEIMHQTVLKPDTTEGTSTSSKLVGTNASKSSTDVGAVVSKAKKAAASLWLILHAQVILLLWFEKLSVLFFAPQN